MIWVYRLLFLPVFILSLPCYAWRMIKRGGYLRGFHHRFGLMARPRPKAQGGVRVWIQAVSVGEVKAIAPLLKSLNQIPELEIILTTTTSTGYELARRAYAKSVLALGIFPIDFWLCSRSTWRRLEPDLIILMEGEIWPEHITQAKQRGVPVVLINARLSDRSFTRYEAFPHISRELLGPIDLILTATYQDLRRFEALGVGSECLSQTGNLKFDVSIKPYLNRAKRIQLRESLGLVSNLPESPSPLIVLGSSTWPGEEAFLLAFLEKALSAGIDCRLLLVPRHAERRAELVSLLKQQKRSWHLRSRGKEPPQPVHIYVGDTTGELAYLSQATDLAFIGNSLHPNEGGQTPIEAAGISLPIVYGPGMSNFREICSTLETAGAARRVLDEAEATRCLLELAQNALRREVMGRAGAAWYQQNQGATDRTFAALIPFLENTGLRKV